MKVTHALTITSIGLALGSAECFQLNMTEVMRSTIELDADTKSALMSYLARADLFAGHTPQHERHDGAGGVSLLQSSGESAENCFSTSFCEDNKDALLDGSDMCCCEIRTPDGQQFADTCFPADACNTYFVDQTESPGFTMTCRSSTLQASFAILTTIVAVMTLAAI